MAHPLGRLCALAPAFALISFAAAQAADEPDAISSRLRATETRARTALRLYHDKADHGERLGDELLWAIERKDSVYERALFDLIIRMGPRAAGAWSTVVEIHTEHKTGLSDATVVESLVRIGNFSGLGRREFMNVLIAPLRNQVAARRVDSGVILIWYKALFKEQFTISPDTPTGDLLTELAKSYDDIDLQDLFWMAGAIQLLHASGRSDPAAKKALLACIRQRSGPGCTLLLEQRPQRLDDNRRSAAKNPTSRSQKNLKFVAAVTFFRVAGETLIHLWPESPEAAIGYAVRARYCTDPQLRLEALTRIGESADVACEPWLVDLLFDSDRRVRIEAILTLGRIGRPDTTATRLLAHLASGTDAKLAGCAKNACTAIEKRAKAARKER